MMMLHNVDRFLKKKRRPDQKFHAVGFIAEDGGLRVEDRRRHQRAVDAAIGDRERAAREILDRQLAARALRARGRYRLLDLGCFRVR